MAGIDPNDVIQRYADVLEDAPNHPAIRDEAELPHPKEVVKRVILHLVKNAKPDADLSSLRVAIFSLADFQTLTAAEKHAIKIFEGGAEDDLDELSAASGAYTAILKRAEAEREQLAEELDAIQHRQFTIDLIELSRWPTMAAPWSTTGKGETWVWGDFFVLFQTNPKVLGEVLSKVLKMDEMKNLALSYPYAATVFYRLDKSPHGASSRPVLSVGLEAVDYEKVQGVSRQAKSDPELRKPVIGLFNAGVRMNFGRYGGDLRADLVREVLFEQIERHLPVTGKPRLIGTIDDAHGHPDTGLPAKRKAGSVWPYVLFGGAILAGLVLFGWVRT